MLWGDSTTVLHWLQADSCHLIVLSKLDLLNNMDTDSFHMTIHFSEQQVNPPHRLPWYLGAVNMLCKECSEDNHWCQMVTEEVLRRVLIESEGILNSKPFGYVFSDIANVNIVTLNLLIMGQHNASLPLVSYCDFDLLSQ